MQESGSLWFRKDDCIISGRGKLSCWQHLFMRLQVKPSSPGAKSGVCFDKRLLILGVNSAPLRDAAVTAEEKIVGRVAVVGSTTKFCEYVNSSSLFIPFEHNSPCWKHPNQWPSRFPGVNSILTSPVAGFTSFWWCLTKDVSRFLISWFLFFSFFISGVVKHPLLFMKRL